MIYPGKAEGVLDTYRPFVSVGLAFALQKPSITIPRIISHRPFRLQLECRKSVYNENVENVDDEFTMFRRTLKQRFCAKTAWPSLEGRNRAETLHLFVSLLSLLPLNLRAPEEMFLFTSFRPPSSARGSLYPCRNAALCSIRKLRVPLGVCHYGRVFSLLDLLLRTYNWKTSHDPQGREIHIL